MGPREKVILSEHYIRQDCLSDEGSPPTHTHTQAFMVVDPVTLTLTRWHWYTNLT